jgi:hypothetical protein
LPKKFQPTSHFLLGVVRVLQGNATAGDAHFVDALQRDPGYSPARGALRDLRCAMHVSAANREIARVSCQGGDENREWEKSCARPALVESGESEGRESRERIVERLLAEASRATPAGHDIFDEVCPSSP